MELLGLVLDGISLPKINERYVPVQEGEKSLFLKLAEGLYVPSYNLEDPSFLDLAESFYLPVFPVGEEGQAEVGRG
jgi:hypothetical protein